MAWTKKQRMTAAAASRSAGIQDEHRKLILQQFPGAMFDTDGKPTGETSSKSKRLTNSDFEQFTAIIERHAGGQVLRYSRYYWRDKADDRC